MLVSNFCFSMGKYGSKIPDEIRELVLNKVKKKGVSVEAAAAENGVCTKTIYRWLRDESDGQPSWYEVNRLKNENRQLLEIIGGLNLELEKHKKFKKNHLRP